MRALSAEARARIGMQLREQGFLLTWDQADRSGPMSDVQRALFILARLYPEMPAEHRESLRHELERGHAAGTWHGFRRPDRGQVSPGPTPRGGT